MPPRLALSALLLALLCAGCPKAHSGGGDGGTDAGPTCKTRDDCQGGLVCKSGQCTTCQRDRECKADEICNPVKQVCEFRQCFGGDCTTHADCSLGEFCVQGLCLKPQAGQPADGGCPGVVPCAKDTDCPEGEKCNKDTLVCEQNVGCYGDAACPDGYYCNMGSHQCEQSCTQATASTVCPQSFKCVSGQCVECTTDADCGAGLTCDTTAGRCAGTGTCFSDRDCIRPQVCNPQTSQCTTTPPPCVSNDDCPVEQVCDIQSGACVSAACLPDSLEPNQTFATAAPISPGLVSNLTLCGGQPDWFLVTLGAGDKVSITVNPPPLSGSNFVTTLYDPTDTNVVASGSLEVDTVAPAAGDYGLEIQSTDARDEYSIQLLVSKGVPCQDDSYEPDDTFTTAALLDPGDHVNLEKCPANEDWYVVSIPRGKTLTATLDADPLVCDLDLYAYDSDGTSLIAKSATTSPTETVTVATTSAGRAFLQVVSTPSAQCPYDLSIAVQ